MAWWQFWRRRPRDTVESAVEPLWSVRNCDGCGIIVLSHDLRVVSRQGVSNYYCPTCYKVTAAQPESEPTPSPICTQCQRESGIIHHLDLDGQRESLCPRCYALIVQQAPTADAPSVAPQVYRFPARETPTREPAKGGRRIELS